MNCRSDQKPEKEYFPGVFMVLASVVIILILSALVARSSYADQVILIPDGVVGAGAWSGVTVGNLSDDPTGGGTADGTYATITGALDTFTVSMSNDVAYSGASINSVTVWVRASAVGGLGAGERITFGSTAPVVSTSGATTLSDDPTRDNFSWLLAGIVTSGDVDGLEVAVNTTSLGGGEEARVFEVWATVNYTPVAGANELNACDNCHAQPPVEGASRNIAAGAVVGSHSKHSAYACTVCHPNNVVLNHRGGQGVNGTEGQIDMLANIQGGSYSLGAAGFLQDNEDGTGLGTCSDVACHGGAATTTPQWGTTGGLGCDGCHGAPPATAAHTAHYTAKGWTNPDIAATTCNTCHPDNTASHSDVTDGIVLLDAGLTQSGTSPAISCNANNGLTGCHNGKYPTPAWNTGTAIACIDCHTVGGSNSATVANPVTGLHNMTQVGVQKHDASLAGGCEACHTKASIGGHWDGSASGATPDFSDLQVGVSGGISGGSYSDAGGTGIVRGTCATTCHSDNAGWSRQWSTAADSTATAAGSARCAVCHGQLGNWRTGTSHEGTFNVGASTRGSGHNSVGGAANVCEDCHAYPSLSNHENGFITVNQDAAWTVTESGAPNYRAWCQGCHSDDGAPTTSGTHTFTQSDTGDGIFPLQTVAGANDPIGSCFGCHGGGTGGASQSNFWPDGSNSNAENTAGAHVAHMTLLGRRVYNEDLTTLLADNGNGTSNDKQRILCGYCHEVTVASNDGDHMTSLPAEVFPNATYARRFQDGASDTGTLATYNGGASGTCSNVDCHNSKTNLPGTYGWYDGGAGDCDMCHTAGGHAEDFANPTSGLHNITPTLTGTMHDTSLTACDTCHSLIPDNVTTQASSHIDGTFVADNGSNTDRYLFSDYTDATPGSCAGGVVGAAGCHAGAGDAGSWKRRWSTTAANSDGTECDNCHGGVNGEGTWTFGANNTVGDGAMSHDRNWDGVGALEVIGQHSADTSGTDRCNTCHVYGNLEYGAFGWSGGSNHGDGQIDMNSSLGYSRSGGDAYGCTGNCHTTGGSHLTENSGWTLGAIAGPSLGCTSCHVGSEGANDQTEVGSSSPHSESTTGLTCEQCHFTAHSARTTGTVPANWDARTMGTDYTADGKVYIIAYGGAGNEAEACWNCHAAQGAVFNSEFDENVASNATSPGARPEGYLTGGESSNWIGAEWNSPNFGYKKGGVASVHQTQSDTAAPITLDTSLSAADVGTISCTACHDVHQVGRNGYESGAKPWLRGTWTSNPFPEDGAPYNGQSYLEASFRGVVPRGAAGEGSTSNIELGGWQIEQNNNFTFSQTYSQYGGLCQNCHSQADVEGTGWTGHRAAVSGFIGSGGSDIFRLAQRGGAGTWQDAHMGHNGPLVPRDSGKGWIGGLRNARQWADGIIPGMKSEPLTTNVGLQWAGGARTTLTFDNGTVDQNFHNFPCSKCHDPHASRLPRLMITNCLDVRHNSWDDPANGNAGVPQGWQSYSADELAYAPTAQNCHRSVDGADAKREFSGEGGWNSITPW
jgi:predicted CxxxxCH...CXXCH cytochrome family protein